MLRTGAPWRDLPERDGPWRTVARRVSRWQRAGLWQAVFDAVKPHAAASGRSTGDRHDVDRPLIRAQQHAAGATKGPQRPTREGVARGGQPEGAPANGREWPAVPRGVDPWAAARGPRLSEVTRERGREAARPWPSHMPSPPGGWGPGREPPADAAIGAPAWDAAHHPASGERVSARAMPPSHLPPPAPNRAAHQSGHAVSTPRDA